MRPLQGVKVIDVTTNISGPTLTMILADLGAEVIKVEKLPAGDEARKMEPKASDDGVYFLNINRQKKSIVLNLKDQSDYKRMLDLIKEADVFVENYRAGIAEKIGLGYEQLKTINPTLVYCSLSAYGQHGPKRDYPGYDAIIQAETGLMSITGSDELARIPVSIVDQGSAMWGALGVVTALYDRMRTNEGWSLHHPQAAAGRWAMTDSLRPEDIDPVIHERVRLSIVSALAVAAELSFNELKETLSLTDGNLSAHARTLEEAGYIVVDKSFRGRRPYTAMRLSAKGRKAFQRYVDTLRQIIDRGEGGSQ